MRDVSTQLLVGGRIYAPDATAMAVTDGVVVWIGQDSVGRALHPDATVVELHGAFVAPAFVDAHVHATSAGLLLTGLDLTRTSSVDALLDQVRNAPGPLVWGHGWDETRWPENRPPTRAEIDEAAAGKTVYLSRIDVHSALVSSNLIIDETRTADGFSADGPLSRAAHHHVRGTAKAAITPAQRNAAQRAFLAHAASMGIASVHECAGPDISGEDDLRELLALGEGPEVVAYWGAHDLPGVEVRGLAGDHFVDGAIGSRTAALVEPYADADTSGALYLDGQQVADHLIKCAELGVQAGFHVIGDAGMAAVIEGFSIAEKALGTPELASARHRLEHVEMVSAEQAQQLAGWGVVASVQPLFDAEWGGPAGMYVQRLGAERGVGLNPFSRLAAAGVVLAFGSDTPVTAIDPWAAVTAAVHHKTEGHGISPRAAFTAHTRGGWRAAGVDDGLTGTLQPGAPATYAVWETGELVVAGSDSRVQRWSTDPRSGVPGLPDLTGPAPVCVRTVLNGRTIYERK
ncbi:amidohydrolase family protein [Lentzea sp. BCCO 10_0856]|uniref:Amidohydrolase family protein n=1 Tax=Lentzea miocenica TaxID=3095431 RepID=A0ABU4T342_9PSEU|nr:amidohydrolase family protein [Lentzea sp. BCCO 10_0856]MDX8032584.1 amidohydrolase family protein [Lentzea sp. BCCO 10_0856]